MELVYRYPVSGEQYQRLMEFIENYAGKMFYGRMDLLFKLFQLLRLEEHSIGLRADSVELVIPSGEEGFIVLDSGWTIRIYMDKEGYWVGVMRP